MRPRSNLPKYPLQTLKKKKAVNSKSEFILGTLRVSKILKPSICNLILDTSHMCGKSLDIDIYLKQVDNFLQGENHSSLKSFLSTK